MHQIISLVFRPHRDVNVVRKIIPHCAHTILSHSRHLTPDNLFVRMTVLDLFCHRDILWPLLSAFSSRYYFIVVVEFVIPSWLSDLVISSWSSDFVISSSDFVTMIVRPCHHDIQTLSSWKSDLVIMTVGLSHQDRQSDFVMMSSRILISTKVLFPLSVLLSLKENNQSNYWLTHSPTPPLYDH